MNILITGIHGFVGSNLANSLHANHTLYGLDIKTLDNPNISRTFSWSDLRSRILPYDIDVIIHLAGKAHNTKKTTDSKVYFAINTDLTKEIYDYYLSSNIKTFIFFSSVKAAADIVEGDILTEDITPNPKGAYGESKIAAENYILSNSPPEKNIYIFRPCMIHGPGNKGNLNLLYKIIKTGIPWPLGSYDNQRSFTSINNLCFIIQTLLKIPIKSGVYNIADDEPLSTNKLIEIICLSLGRKPHILKLSKRFIAIISKIGSILNLSLNQEMLSKLTENYVVSNSKIKEALKLDKLPISSEEGLIYTLKYLNQ